MLEPRAIDLAFALLTADETAARRALAACFDAALAVADEAGQRLAAAGVLVAINAEFADFRGLALWLSRLLPPGLLPGPGPLQQRPLDQARLDAALIVVPLLDAVLSTDDAAVCAAAERLATALGGELTVQAEERILLWKCLFDYRAHRNDTTELARIASQVQDHLRSGGVHPQWQARWWLVAARNHEYFGASDLAADALARAQRLADTHGLAAVRYELLCVEMMAALRAEAGSRVELIARELELLMPDIRAGRLPTGLRAQAWALLWRGDAGAALQRLDRALAICSDVEVPLRERGPYEVLRAYALLALQRDDEALATLQSLRASQLGEQGEVLELLIGLAAGLRAVRAGQASGEQLVCDAIRRCAAQQFERFFLPLPALAAQAAEIALDAGTETEFVSRVVRTRKLVPADTTREAWPWRLQVRVFGTLQVLRDGQPLPFSAKRPKKPLELLALLAAQGHQALPAEAAIAALWPSAEAEAPKASLEVALARLRKLLDVPGAVLLADGGLRLDPRMVWSDVAAFETLEQRWQAGGHGAPGERDSAAAQRAITLYRGALLAGEPLAAAPWQLLREQMGRRYTRLVVGYGAALELQSRWREAAEVYEQALARDVLAEPLYRALMRAQLQLGERAEALRTYARCRELLATVLGVTPAHETRLLREQAAGGSS